MSKSQKGFALLEGLLILIIIAIVGGTGYYVLRSKNQTKETLNAAGNDTPALPGNGTSRAPQKYLVINEWGVKIPILKGDEGLSYKMDSQNDSAQFRNSALDKLSDGCTDNSVVIIRGKAGDEVDGEEGSIGTFSEIYKNPGDSLSGSFRSHIGDYYYLNSAVGGASCVDIPQTDPLGQQAQNEEDNAIDNIFKALEGMTKA